jgi:hypothetical protein
MIQQKLGLKSFYSELLIAKTLQQKFSLRISLHEQQKLTDFSKNAFIFYQFFLQPFLKDG